LERSVLASIGTKFKSNHHSPRRSNSPRRRDESPYGRRHRSRSPRNVERSRERRSEDSRSSKQERSRSLSDDHKTVKIEVGN
jgi:hypothetical protein